MTRLIMSRPVKVFGAGIGVETFRQLVVQGQNMAATPPRSFEYDNLEAALCEFICAAEPTDARSGYDDLFRGGLRARNLGESGGG